MSPWKAIDLLDQRLKAVENYLDAHKLEQEKLTDRLDGVLDLFADVHKFMAATNDHIDALYAANKKAPAAEAGEPVHPPIISCHPGLKCTAWPECEHCGPPRL